MMRTLALSAVAAMGMMLLPVQTASLSAAPALAAKIATPDSAVEQARRNGGRSFGGGRSVGRSFGGGRSYGRSFGGGRSFGRVYGGRSYGRHYGGRHYSYRRHHRRGYIYGAGIPFFYGAYGYYGNCDYYYRKWMRTGSRYWRNLYRSCAW